MTDIERFEELKKINQDIEDLKTFSKKQWEATMEIKKDVQNIKVELSIKGGRLIQ